MLISLLEETRPLLEINMEKTKQQFFAKLTQRATRDNRFWRFRENELGEELDPIISKPNFPWDDGSEESHAILEEVFEYAYNTILKFDPTDGRANRPNIYSLWLIQRYVNKAINSWEDLGNCKDMLKSYDRFKVTKLFDRMTMVGDLSPSLKAKYNDINRISGDKELAEVVKTGRDWLRKDEAENLKEDYEMYWAEAESGGLTVLWPPRADFESFAKYGMVVKLNTHETSRKLFNSDCQWCTARDSPYYFNQYNAQGDIITVIDNANDTFYQFHYSERQYMAADNHPINSVVLIPLPLMKQVANVMFGGSMSKLLSFMKDAVDANGALVKHIWKLSEETDTPGITLFHEYMDDPDGAVIRYGMGQTGHVIPLYLRDAGELPPMADIKSCLKKFSPTGYRNETDRIFMYCMLVRMLFPSGKKINQALLPELLRMTSDPELLRLQYYLFVQTPAWPKIRDKVLERWCETRRGIEFTFIHETLHFEYGTLEDNIRYNTYAPRPDIIWDDVRYPYVTLQLTRPEVEAILDRYITFIEPKHFNQTSCAFPQLLYILLHTTNYGREGGVDVVTPIKKLFEKLNIPIAGSELGHRVMDAIVDLNFPLNMADVWGLIDIRTYVRHGSDGWTTRLSRVVQLTQAGILQPGLTKDDILYFVQEGVFASLQVLDSFVVMLADRDLCRKITDIVVAFALQQGLHSVPSIFKYVFISALVTEEEMNALLASAVVPNGHSGAIMEFKSIAEAYYGMISNLPKEVRFTQIMHYYLVQLKNCRDRFFNPLREIQALTSSLAAFSKNEITILFQKLFEFEYYFEFMWFASREGLTAPPELLRQITPDLVGPEMWQDMVDMGLTPKMV